MDYLTKSKRHFAKKPNYELEYQISTSPSSVVELLPGTGKTSLSSNKAKDPNEIKFTKSKPPCHADKASDLQMRDSSLAECPIGMTASWQFKT
jgi:hypothetical protein